MEFFKPWASATAAFAVGATLTLSAPVSAAPSQFTSKGEAVSYMQGKATRVPNTLYYNNGHIRLDMATPVSADGENAFSVVLAQEGGKSITLLNPQQKQAMKLDATSLEAVTENPSLAKISSFKLSEFGKTFRSQSKKVGSAAVAGQTCSIFEQKGKDGHFRLWLSDQYDIPMAFTYYEKGKPAFEYKVSNLALSVNLPASSFKVPSGYEMTDLSEMLRGMDEQLKPH
jgi:hypothetical protein